MTPVEASRSDTLREEAQALVREAAADPEGAPVSKLVRLMKEKGYTGDDAVYALEGLIKDGAVNLTAKYTVLVPQ